MHNAFADFTDRAHGISREAFVYGEFSRKVAMHEMYGEQSEGAVSSWTAVEVSTDSVVEMKLNPIQILRNAKAK